MTEENIAFRLKFLIEKLGLSSSQFADQCEIARPTLSQLLSGRNKKISNLIIEQIHKAFPNISIGWLLFGEGDVFSSPIGQPIKCADESNEIRNNEGEGVISDIISSETPNHHSSSSNAMKPDQMDPERQTFLKNASENPKSRYEGQTIPVHGKENGVNLDENASVNSICENVNSIFNSPNLIAEIANLKEKRRKVDHITIYYDDSTFETFFPSKS